MKIEKKVSEKVRIIDIPVGDCFTFGGSNFMRVGYSDLDLKCPECDRELDSYGLFCNTGAGYLAVDLCNGQLYPFSCENVIPIEMKAVEV